MPDDLTSAFAALGAATLGESGGRPMAPRIRPAWTGARVAGPAFPVACSAGDNLAVHVAVAEAPAGSVLVVSVGLEPARGYWGEVLTTAAVARGIVGLVIDGGVRDIEALFAQGFPVFSPMIALRGATKTKPGHIGDAALVGDVNVGCGDWIVGDSDGVTVIPRDHVADVRAAGEARAEKEEEYFAQLRAGRTTVELLGLDADLIDRS
jgi:4-hydroxy-4-methyl-2-oxoglutarate aldolase